MRSLPEFAGLAAGAADCPSRCRGRARPASVAAARFDSGRLPSLPRLTVPFMAAALVLGPDMRGKPLSTEVRDIAQGAAEAPEY
jgi:hypothetical protein